MTHATAAWRAWRRVAWAVVASTVFPTCLWGQAAWEYSPYDVRVRLSVVQGTGTNATRLGESIAARADIVLGKVWKVTSAEAAPQLGALMLQSPEALTAEQVTEALSAEDLAADKVFLAALAWRNGSREAHVREFDCRSRRLGQSVARTALLADTVVTAVWDAMLDSFTPVARIETVDGDRVTARLRAGGLILDEHSPALVEAGMVLEPVLRRNERGGQPAKGGIQIVPWTTLEVTERRDSLLDCRLDSGYRGAIPGRASARVERLALLIKPRWPSTRLLLRARDNPDKPLCAYEIHVRPDPDAQPKLLGVTDLDGAFELPRGDGTLQVLFVRNGKQLLARLPLVPGQAETLTAKLPDDDPRLQAEGFVTALGSRVVDLVARREILAARIRARLKAGKPDEAQQLLEEFRKLETRADLSRDLEQFRQRLVTADKLTKTRIDLLIADAQKLLLLKALSDELLVQLTRDVTAAKPAG